MELLLPDGRPPGLALPSYVKLDMAFGVGAGGQLFDKSRYRSHGAINGPDWAAGLHGYSLDFDAAGLDYVEIPAAYTQLDFTAEDFSIVARIRTEDLTVHNRIFTRGLWNADGYVFRIGNTGRITIFTSQLAAGQLSDSAAAQILINTWYTVGFSRTGASIIPYKNGVDVSSTVGVHEDPLTCARNAKIGVNDALNAEGFDGHIEFLRVFGGIALTASEHLAWHNALA